MANAGAMNPFPPAGAPFGGGMVTISGTGGVGGGVGGAGAGGSLPALPANRSSDPFSGLMSNQMAPNPVASAGATPFDDPFKDLAIS